MKKIYLIAFVLFLANHLSYSQHTTKSFNSKNSGLPGNTVKAVYIDANGVKWFGTNAGLSRYDGDSWKTYTTENTNNKMTSNVIVDMAFDNHPTFGDELWLATDKGGTVVAFDVDGVTSATSYTTDNSDIASDQVNTVTVDINNTRWFGTAEGMSVFKGSEWFNYTKTDFFDQGIPDNYIRTSTHDDTYIYAATNKGLGRFKYDADAISGASVWDGIYTGLANLSENVLSVFIDAENNQWIGTDAGVGMHTGDDGKNDPWSNYYKVEDGLPDNNVIAINQDIDGAMWFGTYGGVARAVDGEVSVYTTSDGLSSDTIYDIATDTDGSLWFATHQGVSHFVDGAFNNFMSASIDKPEISDGKEGKITFSPNPATDYSVIRFSLPEGGITTLSLFNLKGQLVDIISHKLMSAGLQEIRWDIPSRLPVGAYHVRIESADFISFDKIVVF